MKRYSRHSVIAATGCATLLTSGLVACGTDTPPPEPPPAPPAAQAPAVPGPENNDTSSDTSGDEEYVRVCTNPETNERVDDELCQQAAGDEDNPDQPQEVHYHNNGSGILTPLLWYYIGRSSAHGAGPIIPAVGSSIAGTPGTTQAPKQGVIAKDVARDSRPFSESYRSATKTSPAVGKTGTTTGGKKTGNSPDADTNRNKQNSNNTNNRTGNNNTGDNGNKSGTKSGKTGGFGGGKATGGSHGG
ncbi:hypothetical protein [Corynebacterium aquilae]|uniref:Lipoprotein n=1 Tax=Corynebacterium aquilae DSM 44791 TaxID=1431546 RepID=A0A1L7CE35_9CORY|nr:hypothetical protein [Corynebacterium aquilae]APT84088.1 hypothetical protein CAQU_02260 [Corynebacterium aquilae DSM 44791]